MTSILTVRLAPDLKAKAERRAAELGLDRGKYVRSLIEQDVEAAGRRPAGRTFASEDFIGSVPLGEGPYTNRRVRALVRRRARGVRETNR
jgi:hypothetical protein